MLPGTLISEDIQVEYGGVLFGGKVGREIVNMNLFTLPSLRTNDTPRPQQDGNFIGDDYYGAKTFSMEIEVWGRDADEFQGRLAELLQATNRRRLPEELVIRLEGWPDDFLLYARPIRRSNVLNVESVIGYVARFSVEWRADNPFIFNLTEQVETATLTVTAGTGGGQFDASFDYSFGSSEAGQGVPTTALVDNNGNAETNPIIELTGPIQNPNFTVVSPSGEVTFMQLTGTVDDVDTLVIDVANRTIILNGVSSEYQRLVDPSSWFVLAPGVSSITLGGLAVVGSLGAASPDPVATIRWRSASV